MKLWLTFFILIIPFIWLLFSVYKRVKKLLLSPLNYAVFTLCVLIAMDAYFMLIFYLTNEFIGGDVSHAIGATSFAVVMFSYLLISINLIAVFVLTIVYAIGRGKNG